MKYTVNYTSDYLCIIISKGSMIGHWDESCVSLSNQFPHLSSLVSLVSHSASFFRATWAVAPWLFWLGELAPPPASRPCNCTPCCTASAKTRRKLWAFFSCQTKKTEIQWKIHIDCTIETGLEDDSWNRPDLWLLDIQGPGDMGF